MAGKTTGITDHFFVEDHDISCDVASVTKVSGGPTELNVTTLCNAGMSRLPGIFSGEIDFNVFMDIDVGQEHEELSILPYTDVILSYFRGAEIGQPAACMSAKQINYEWNREANGNLIGQVKSVSGPSGLGLEWCKQLTAGRVVHAAPHNEASVDGLASSAHGASFYLHVFGVGTGTVQPVAQDSADNVSFAGIAGVVFSPVVSGSGGGQRVHSSRTQVIRQYVRFATTGTFTDASVAAAFIRYLWEPTL